MNKDTKQVIVVRKDLNMRKGKMVAQGAHASLGAFLSTGSITKSDETSPGLATSSFYNPLLHPALEQWILGKFTKICVSCNSEAELLELAQQAKDEDLIHFLCKDAGLTEFDGVPTYTTLAIGPEFSDTIDKITGHLKLL